MPLWFLFTLVTYLVVVAACFRANSLLAVGLLNTATLAIILLAVLKALSNRSQNRFWFGFLLFFAGLNVLYFSGSGAPVLDFTLADSAGSALHSMMTNQPTEFGTVFREQVWYGYISHCFIATFFGVCGGFFAMVIFNGRKPTLRDD
jgi:hypothetical protein